HPLVESPFQERDGALSPDGRWLAYVSDESGILHTYIRPLAGPGRPQRVSVKNDGGWHPRWRTDGKELFFLANDGIYAAPIRATANGLEAGDPAYVVGPRIDIRSYDVAPDGGRVLVNAVQAGDDTSEISVVSGWGRR